MKIYFTNGSGRANIPNYVRSIVRQVCKKGQPKESIEETLRFMLNETKKCTPGGLYKRLT